MSFTAKDVMYRASLLLQDADLVRWTPVEMRNWLNDGIREIALQQPQAVTKTVEISLDQGTHQTLPDNVISLFRITRNLTAAAASATGRKGGRDIEPIRSGTMGRVMPNWQSPDVLPYSAEVVHVIMDDAYPRDFFVAPGNDGTGLVEAIAAVYPAEVPVPSSGSVLSIDSYTANVDLPDIYRNALVDYIVFRCFSKDATIPGAAERAAAHYQLFAGSLQIKPATDSALMNQDGK